MPTDHHPKEQRHFYLEDIPLDEALTRFNSALEEAGGLVPTASERVSLEEALGRVTAEPVWARISSPHYHAAAMDGAAIRSEDTSNSSERAPVRLKIGEQAQWVDTGMPLPPGFDAVVMIENIQVVEEGLIEVMLPVAPWQHVRLLGEDIIASELILSEGHLLKPMDLGSVGQAGISHVEVRRRPKVAVIPTGTELVPPGSNLKPGNIIESNSLVLAGLVKEWGGVATRFAPVPDDYDQLKRAILEALSEHDIVVVNAGASAGRRDFTASLVADLGKVVVHGVAIRPGHPVVLGLVKGKPVVGVPGYPVSAALTMELFVKPLVYRLQGAAPPRRRTIEAVMTRKVFSPMGEDEFLRVKVGQVGGELLATPLQRGAGATMSMVRADGWVCIPRGSEGLQERQRVRVDLLSNLEDIENGIVVVGSHDLSLDVLANHLHKQYPRRNLSSSNVGSLGGLIALRRGESHLAGSHLLDEESGEYNVSYVKRLLGDKEMVIINLVYREQGLMVAKGNPKRLSNLADLRRQGVSFINRQRGAGTRVLLDFKLKEMGIDSAEIDGYERAAFTHLAVAAAIASGTADAGLGIVAAARALDLDFVPLLKERYDLVIPRIYYDSPFLEPLLTILQQPSFRAEVEKLGGYDTSLMGQIIARL
ncbi:MAG: molybdopterin biosynthesis protein [Chloroflexi bacterium]|nr:molybdopterin biosynthesis protein [Chloroflexota bacterium]